MKSPQCIYIIEDAKILRLSLAEILSEDYEVIAVNDGLEALSALQARKPDVILLDLMLPLPFDGFTLLKLFKNNPETANIPVIIMSALSDEDKIIEALELGANDYLVKPFRSKELILKIRNLTQLFAVKNPDKEISPEQLPTKSALTFEAIAVQMIEDSNMSIPEIAKKLMISVSRLERIIKLKYQVTPKQYIMDLKLKKAELLLRQRNKTVGEISQQLGFNSVAYFCQCFKKKFGTPPKLYSAKFI